MLYFLTVVLIFERCSDEFFRVGLKLWMRFIWRVWSALSADESKDVLRGTTLEVYRFLLKSSKPVGIRELQRALNLSSPSVATYHLSKLEDAGLLKRQDGGYTVDRFLLENSIKISRFLIPRYLFYAVFAFAVLFFELTLLRPNILTREYVFSVVATIIFVLAFCYETVKTYQRGNL